MKQIRVEVGCFCAAVVAAHKAGDLEGRIIDILSTG